MADKGGYIGRSPGDSNTIITRETFEPTGVQTNFTITAGYKVGYIIGTLILCYFMYHFLHWVLSALM